ncbi:hypothetical protein [Massilia sp. TWR1-2-2]|uniref:hypothetical protein n=1 Tax=Massilia sp. TWR1-2-2 TaxID=2804584 RepID=UPI003CE78D0D
MEKFPLARRHHTFDQRIADEKTESIVAIFAKIAAASNDNRPARKLVEGRPIVLKQRVTG